MKNRLFKELISNFYKINTFNNNVQIVNTEVNAEVFILNILNKLHL